MTVGPSLFKPAHRPSGSGVSKDRKRRVLIVDDHPIVRQGLRRLIEAEADLEVCGEAETAREAKSLIRELEPVPRGPYCGLVGWARVSRGGAVRARLAVGIRTFWWSDGALRFGTGAGITWGSDPQAEWAETELKARRLVALASGEG